MFRNSSKKHSVKQRFNKPWYLLLLPVWVFASFMLAQVIVVLLVMLLEAVGVRFDGVNAAVVNSALSAVIYIITLAVVIGAPWLIFKRKTTKTEVGLQRLPSWLEVFTSPVAFIVYVFCSGIIVALSRAFIPFLNFEQAQVTGFEEISQQYELILAFLTLVVIAPVAEEILFRGYLLGKLRNHAPTWVAILVSSALFGLVHFNASVSIDTFVLGIVLAWMRIKTGSLWPAILIHMIKNGLAFYLLFINPTFLSTLGG